MCFSSTASFSSSVLLGAMGIVSITRAKSTSQKVLAGIPLAFCVQQFSEGVLWVSLQHPAWQHWQHASTVTFLIFAQAVWPVYIPLCTLLPEQEKRKRRLIFLTMLCGIAISSYFIYAFCRYPVYALIEDHHIRYVQHFTLAQQWYYGLLYFLPTIIPPVISSKKELRWLGYLFFASYVLARLLFHFYEISVWCFFGAIISLVIFTIINRPMKPRWWKL